MKVLLSRLAAAVAIIATVAAARSADGPGEGGSPFLDDARAYLITLHPTQGDAHLLKLREPSILNWSNPARLQEHGAIYVWTDKARPLAIGSMFTYVLDNQVFTKHEFESLTSEPLEADFRGNVSWAPTTPGIEWNDFIDAPAPGPSHAARLLQMRQLARRYRAELIDPKGDRNVLRLAPRPLYEYSNAELGIADGAIFAFVVATDPEVLLVMEATQGPSPKFRYAFARFHYWELSVMEGDTQVWSAPLDRSHEMNRMGDPDNLVKPYNSFRVGEPVPTEGEKSAP